MLEDSETDADIIQRQLKKENIIADFNVVMTKAAFLEALEQYEPDLILADNSLPQFDAADALEAVRKTLPDVPFILVTGIVSDEFAAAIIKQGADDYILKDRLTRLPAAIESMLKQRYLDSMSLTTAIEKHLKEFEKKWSIYTLFTSSIDESLLSDRVKITLFRILQESLSNIAMHSLAKKISISLEQKGDEIIMIIQDNGLGFNVPEITAKETPGILGIKKRASIVGGKAEISSVPGEGATVAVTIPIVAIKTN